MSEQSIKQAASKYTFALRASAAGFLAAIVLFALDEAAIAGPLLVATFVLAAYGVRGSEKLRGISFSLLIFAGVTLALCYPAPLVSWGTFKLSALIVPLLQVIMFGMGAAMGASDFITVVKAPKLVILGVACQFIIMPFTGFALAHVFPLDPEVAAGVILIGAAPSGLASNVMTYISKGNLPLSVTVTTFATLLAPVFTPFYMQWLGGQYIAVDPWSMMISIMQITILPIIAGLVFNRFLHGKTECLDRLMPALSMAGIVLILMIMTAGGRDNLLDIGLLLILISLLHNLAGYGLGYWSARALGADERSCRTIAFEVGQQNAGLATGLAQEMGKMATVGLVPTVFGSLMNITGATLATWWRDRPPQDGLTIAADTQPQSIAN
jgi:BASS family bile acid:Na+ symporter